MTNLVLTLALRRWKPVRQTTPALPALTVSKVTFAFTRFFTVLRSVACQLVKTISLLGKNFHSNSGFDIQFFPLTSIDDLDFVPGDSRGHVVGVVLIE